MTAQKITRICLIILTVLIVLFIIRLLMSHRVDYARQQAEELKRLKKDIREKRIRDREIKRYYRREKKM